MENTARRADGFHEHRELLASESHGPRDWKSWELCRERGNGGETDMMGMVVVNQWDISVVDQWLILAY